MAEVFLAFDTLLQRSVALKVLSFEDAPNPHAATAALLREARVGASLKHPNIVATFDVVEEEGTAFIVMELVEGESLRSMIANGAPASLAQKLRWMGEVASALDAAHAQ